MFGLNLSANGELIDIETEGKGVTVERDVGLIDSPDYSTSTRLPIDRRLGRANDIFINASSTYKLRQYIGYWE